MPDLTYQELQAALAKTQADFAKHKSDRFKQAFDQGQQLAKEHIEQEHIEQLKEKRALAHKAELETLRKNREAQLRLQIAGAILVAVLALAFPVFSAHQEAAAYNRITNGPHVTTWEALFLELRVEACNSQR